MAGTISYLHDPNQTVWVITPCGEGLVVLQGVVVRVKGTVLASTEVTYDIRIGNNAGTEEFAEIDVFATLADAVAEYEVRLS